MKSQPIICITSAPSSSQKPWLACQKAYAQPRTGADPLCNQIFRSLPLRFAGRFELCSKLKQAFGRVVAPSARHFLLNTRALPLVDLCPSVRHMLSFVFRSLPLRFVGRFELRSKLKQAFGREVAPFGAALFTGLKAGATSEDRWSL